MPEHSEEVLTYRISRCDPNDLRALIDAYKARATFYYHCGRSADGIKDYKKIIRIADSPRIRGIAAFNVAMAYKATGRLTAAIYWFSKASEEVPTLQRAVRHVALLSLSLRTKTLANLMSEIAVFATQLVPILIPPEEDMSYEEHLFSLSCLPVEAVAVVCRVTSVLRTLVTVYLSNAIAQDYLKSRAALLHSRRAMSGPSTGKVRSRANSENILSLIFQGAVSAAAGAVQGGASATPAAAGAETAASAVDSPESGTAASCASSEGDGATTGVRVAKSSGIGPAVASLCPDEDTPPLLLPLRTKEDRQALLSAVSPLVTLRCCEALTKLSGGAIVHIRAFLLTGAGWPVGSLELLRLLDTDGVLAHTHTVSPHYRPIISAGAGSSSFVHVAVPRSRPSCVSNEAQELTASFEVPPPEELTAQPVPLVRISSPLTEKPPHASPLDPVSFSFVSPPQRTATEDSIEGDGAISVAELTTASEKPGGLERQILEDALRSAPRRTPSLATPLSPGTRLSRSRPPDPASAFDRQHVSAEALSQPVEVLVHVLKRITMAFVGDFYERYTHSEIFWGALDSDEGSLSVQCDLDDFSAWPVCAPTSTPPSSPTSRTSSTAELPSGTGQRHHPQNKSPQASLGDMKDSRKESYAHLDAYSAPSLPVEPTVAPIDTILKAVSVLDVDERPSPADMDSIPPPVLKGYDREPLLHAHPELLGLLASALPRLTREMTWNLLYSSRDHGISFRHMLSRSSVADSSMLVVLDRKGYCFGGFNPAKWEVHPRYFGTANAFVYSFGQLSNPKPRIYYSSGENDYFVHCSDIIAFGGGEHGHAIAIDNSLRTGRSGPTNTFSNPILASDTVFEIYAVEVWGFTV